MRLLWLGLGLGLLLVLGCSPRATEPNLAQQAEADLKVRQYRPLTGPLSTLVEDSTFQGVPTQVHPLLGHQAPDFQLQDTDDQPRRLSAFLQKGPVVLVFYYGYTCNHCVSQLFGLSKDIEKFRELGAEVVAISPDETQLTRQRYKTYGAFAFPVLWDPENRIAEQYGCYDRKADEPTHGTFVIGQDGKIVWAYRGEEPFVNNRTLLVELYRYERKR
ncbi:MAG: peroxiredoxin family protein [Gemmataceae bacterium]